MVYQITRRQVGYKPGWYGVLFDVIACIAVKNGDALSGAKLFGAAETDYESVHLAAVILEATQLDAFNGHRALYNEHGNAPYIAAAKLALGEASFEVTFSEGKALSFAPSHALAQSILT